MPIVVAGLLLAFLAGLLVLFALLAHEALAVPTQSSLDVLGVLAWAVGAFGHGAALLVWRAALVLCLAPVLVVGLVGEVARLRSAFWYAGATGASTAAVPLLMRAGLSLSAEAGPGEGRLTLLLFLTGVAAGGTYWIVTGRTATSR